MNSHLINVVFTRDKSGLRDAVRGLDARRFNVCPCETIKVRPVPHTAALAALLGEMRTFDFVVFTSQSAVREAERHLRRAGIAMEQLNRACICAVGPVTARKLEACGVSPRVMPTRHTATALAELFPTMQHHSPKVLFFCGNLASNVIPQELTRKGYSVTSAVVYETSLRDHLDKEVEQLISNGGADCIAFTSPSSVVALTSLKSNSRFAEQVRGNATIASIGPTTSAACKDAGLTVAIEPEHYTVKGLAKAIAKHFGPEDTTAHLNVTTDKASPRD